MGLRGVIADDEVLIRMYIREILENNGYEVAGAVSYTHLMGPGVKLNVAKLMNYFCFVVDSNHKSCYNTQSIDCRRQQVPQGIRCKRLPRNVQVSF